ncbi:hypothetical protein BC629DRAFT_253592 [Irpex lacteus]|nr:hypothetical protein BC629DRAFT_253592 [Irpex lacteus]
MFNFFLPLWDCLSAQSNQTHGYLVSVRPSCPRSSSLTIALYLASPFNSSPLYLGGCYMSGWERRVGWWGKSEGVPHGTFCHVSPSVQSDMCSVPSFLGTEDFVTLTFHYQQHTGLPSTQRCQEANKILRRRSRVGTYSQSALNFGIMRNKHECSSPYQSYTARLSEY